MATALLPPSVFLGDLSWEDWFVSSAFSTPVALPRMQPVACWGYLLLPLPQCHPSIRGKKLPLPASLSEEEAAR
jgi:hypothetical protein